MKKIGIKHFVKEYLASILFITILAIFALTLIPVRIVGNSMNNTLKDGDLAFACRDWLVQDYKNGDIVILQKEGLNEDEPIIKRIIATEGQTVDINAVTGKITVDGVELNEPYAIGSGAGQGAMIFPVTIKENHVFVVGDNRDHSYDSRFESVGQLHEDTILGKCLFLVLPVKENGERDYNRIGFTN